MVVLSRAARLIGAVALVAQLVVVAIPPVQSARQAAREETGRQVCGIALDPSLGGSAADSCDLRSPDTWLLTIDREPVVVRVVDDDVVQLRGADVHDLTELARRVEPMAQESFEQENRYWFERYREV